MAQKQQSSITEGLFGFSIPTIPEFGQQLPIQKFRGSTPLANITESYRQAGESLQGSIRSLFGQQTPQEATVQKANQQEKNIRDAIITFQGTNPEINIQTPDGLRKLANFAVTTNPDLRMFSIQLNKQADAVEQKQAAADLSKQKTLSEIKKNLREEKLSYKLTNNQIAAIGVLGLPVYDSIKDYDVKTRMKIAQETFRIAQKIDPANIEKRMNREEKRKQRLNNRLEQAGITVQNINDVITDLETSEKNESFFKISPAGFGGLFTWLPDSDFKNLAKSLQTIKANIGFDQLQQLKEASETGGALGQVSNFELENLQAVRGSLEQTQSPEQLLRNTKRIKESYGNYLRSIYNNLKIDRETKIRVKQMMIQLDIQDYKQTSAGSQIILKYNDKDAEILMNKFTIAMSNLRKTLGRDKVQEALNNNTITTTNVLREVEKKLLTNKTIKPKGK